MPDLVSKLREVIAKGKVGWMDSTDFSHELGYALGGNKVYPDAEDCTKAHPCIAIPDAVYPCTAKRVIVFDADELESLLGLEGQAAEPPTDPLFTELKVRRWLHYFKDDYAAIASAINAVVKQAYKLAQPSPSTPIVPSTAGLSADWPECKEFYDLMQYYRHAPVMDQPFTGKRYEAVKEWLRAQVNALLGAAKPAEPEPIYTHFDPQTHVVTVIPASVEARIRKDVLEEAAQYVSQHDNLGNIAADEIRALAERPAPAGEARISRWQCPHCAHVNSMASANCENCKIPLVNTAGEVKGASK